MRARRLPLFLLIVLALAACGLPSIHPLYRDRQSDTVFVPELLGSWEYVPDDNDDGYFSFHFERAEGNTYALTVREGRSADAVVASQYDCHLVRIGDELFLDSFLREAPINEEAFYWVMHVIPVHLFFHLEVEGDILRIAMLRSEALLRDFDEGNVEVANVDLPSESGHERLLTASPGDMQEFLAANLHREKYLYDDAGEFRRVDTPAAIREPEAVLEQQVELWNAGDLEGFVAAGYWSSPELVFQGEGGRAQGYDALLARYREHYTGEHEMGKLRFDDVEVLPSGSRHALVRGRWELLYSDDSQEGGWFTLWMQRVADGWRIVHDQTSSDSATE